MGAFLYRLERKDGAPADPATLKTAVPDWRPGDTIPLARGRMLRVIEARAAKGTDDQPVLVVEAI